MKGTQSTVFNLPVNRTGSQAGLCDAQKQFGSDSGDLAPSQFSCHTGQAGTE
jgi:hypothetical protein